MISLSHCSDISKFEIKEPVVRTNVSATLRVLRTMGVPYLSCTDRRKAELERHLTNWNFAFNSEIEAQKAAYGCLDSILYQIEGLRGQARNRVLRVLVWHIASTVLLKEIDSPRMRIADLSEPHRELLADAILSYRVHLRRYNYVERHYLKQRVPVDIILDIELCEELEVK